MSQLDRIETKLDQLLAAIGTNPDQALTPRPTPPAPGTNWRHAHINCTRCDTHGNIDTPTGIEICE